MHVEFDRSYVRLISSDDREFEIPKEWARTSRFLARVLDTDFKSPEANKIFNMTRVTLEMIDGETLEVIVNYMQFKSRHNGQLGIPEFKIDPERLLMKVLIAADFLEI